MTHRQDEPNPRIQPTRILLRPRSTSGEQKRGFDRTSTSREVSAWADGAEPAVARLVNVSPTGVQVTLDHSLLDGARIEIEALPDRLLPAVVRWTREQDGQVVVGAEWTTPLPIDDVWKIRALDPEAEHRSDH